MTEAAFLVALRDWYAGQALAALDPRPGDWDTAARLAYEAADAMLKRRSEEDAP